MSDIPSIGHDYVGRSKPGSLNHAERVARYDRTEATDTQQLAGDVEHRRGTDRVELSAHARYLADLRAMPEVRQDRVDEMREALKEPGYLNDERLNVAISRLLEDLDTFEF